MPGYGKVGVACGQLLLYFECLLGEAGARVTDGYGGWEAIDRPKQLPFTRWVGAPPYQMEMALVFDSLATGGNVEHPIGLLERMAREPGGLGEPPIVKVVGPLPRSSSVAWVITGLDWGDALRGDDGLRVRQEVSVTLLQYTEPDGIKISVAKKRKAKKKKPKRKAKPKTRKKK